MKKFIALGILVFALVFAVSASSVSASHWSHQGDVDVTVTTSNKATVKNYVYSVADTGYNTANGGRGGSGRNGGNGGKGGDIATGDATATSVVENYVNSTEVDIDLCGCHRNRRGDITVTTTNKGYVKNNVSSSANTGYNTANGGNGGSGRNGGDGGRGGDIDTGDADAFSSAVTIMNTTVVKIR